MKRLRSILLPLFGLLIFGGSILALYWVGIRFFSYVGALPKEIGAALIAGTATIMVPTLTVVVGRYFERKKERDAAYRDKKTAIYDEFLERFFKVVHSQSENEPTVVPEELSQFFRDFMRKLILWADPSTIESFLNWKNHASRGEVDAKTFILMDQFLLALRKDLGHSNFGIKEGLFARLFLADPDLFLQLLKENPKITLAEVAAAEERKKKEEQ